MHCTVHSTGHTTRLAVRAHSESLGFVKFEASHSLFRSTLKFRRYQPDLIPFPISVWNEEVVLELQANSNCFTNKTCWSVKPFRNQFEILESSPSFDQSFSFSSHEWENCFWRRRILRHFPQSQNFIFYPGLFWNFSHFSLFILNYYHFSLFLSGATSSIRKTWGQPLTFQILEIPQTFLLCCSISGGNEKIVFKLEVGDCSFLGGWLLTISQILIFSGD